MDRLSSLVRALKQNLSGLAGATREEKDNAHMSTQIDPFTQVPPQIVQHWGLFLVFGLSFMASPYSRGSVPLELRSTLSILSAGY